MNIAVHKFYDRNNRNGCWFNIVTEYMGLMDENREYCVVSETERDYWVKESETGTQNSTT